MSRANVNKKFKARQHGLGGVEWNAARQKLLVILTLQWLNTRVYIRVGSKPRYVCDGTSTSMVAQFWSGVSSFSRILASPRLLYLTGCVICIVHHSLYGIWLALTLHTSATPKKQNTTCNNWIQYNCNVSINVLCIMNVLPCTYIKYWTCDMTMTWYHVLLSEEELLWVKCWLEQSECSYHRQIAHSHQHQHHQHADY